MQLQSNLSCELLAQANTPHLQQIYTGFAMLARAGRIRLHQRLMATQLVRPGAPPHLIEVGTSQVVVVVNGKRIGYDVHDAGEVDAELLDRVDVYFKRSWEAPFVAACAAPERVLPLGANVWIHEASPSRLAWQRAGLGRGRERLKTCARALGADVLLGDRLFTPRLADLEAEPPVALEPRVLFLAEAWDPQEAPSAETAAERVSINALRAACMRALRDAFGERATCGFRATPFAMRSFSDLAVNDPGMTRKRHYLGVLRQHPICVATSGLHRSIGWKFAEYLSMSRAIVSEKLHMRLPGEFSDGRNYLEFDSAENCVAAVRALVDDAGFRTSLMRNNRDYYLASLRPDVLVAASLRAAFALPQIDTSPR